MMNKYNKILFIIVIICGIIVVNGSLYADDINLRPVTYTLGTNDYTFEFYTDSIKFHTKANGYEKYKGMETSCNMDSIIDTNKSKMQGYGNYEFKPDTNLFSFIDYCYGIDPQKTKDSAYKDGNNDFEACDFAKLMSYRNKVINMSFFENFWKNMCIDSNFNNYQDNFFFSKYTYPASDKIGINIHTLRNVYNKDESIKEYLTCLTSYIFSITPQAQVEGLTFGKGDLVPFLYYKENTDMNVRNHIDGLKDIAKYAYVALIEGWCTLPTPYHLWENEYNLLFGSYEPEKLDYDLETLKEWYDKTYNKYKRDKGKKGNNLLGSDINHIIESDYSIETQVEATEYYLRQVFNELGINNDFKETMARNELMAKYMVQQSSFQDTIKDYEVTIKFMEENLQRGTHEEQNTHTVVTSDFQTLEFNYKMNRRFSEHSDEDTINDGEELGDEKWIDITEFAKKTYEDAKLKGEPHKATFEAQVEDIIENNGAYTDFNGNKVYGSVKWDDKKLKVLYRVYDYKSNPKLNDTDFDGLLDNADSKSIDNKFKGTSTVETGVMNVDFNNDFRWFFTNPNKYNDELAVMSLIMSILSDRRAISLNQVVGYNNMESYMTNIGFKDIKNKFKIKVDEKTNLNANVYIGHKEIDYYGNKKIVYGIFIGDIDNNNTYRKIIANYKDEEIINYYENIAIDIIEYININKVNTTNDICYWIAGKSVAGAVANIVSKHLIDDGNEIFCYTFGAPSNNVIGKGIYSSIKNIVNEDDIIPKLLKSNNSFSIYGEKYNGSIKYDYMMEYKDLFNKKNYKGDYLVTNYISNEYKDIRKNLENEWFYDRLSKYLVNGSKMYQDEFANTQDIGLQLDSCKDSILDAKSSKAYYILAKNLNGFDIENSNTNYDEYIILPKYEETRVNSKNYVYGNGTKERPYWSDAQSLVFDTRENEFWCKFTIDGATDINYIISDNYIINVFVKTIGEYEIIRELNGMGRELVYKLDEINNYENEYLVHIKNTSINDLGHIELKFIQHYDIREFDNYLLRWERDEEGVILRDDIFKYKTYCKKEFAPTLVNLELNTDESLIEKYINGVLKGKEYYELVKSTVHVVLAGVKGLATGGIMNACRELGIAIIREAIDYDHFGWAIFSRILPNRYTTADYKKDLVRISNYHLEDITAFVNEPADLAICDYDILIYERYLNPLTCFGLVGMKGCNRWEDNMVYGIPGVVGRWNNGLD